MSHTDDSFRPSSKYGQIAQNLRERIGNGQYPVGARLPTELALAGEFDVNPLTVRRALAMLQEKGLITRQQGRGTFVRASGKRPTRICFFGNMQDDLELARHSALLAAAQAQQLQLTSLSLNTQPIAADDRVRLIQQHVQNAEAAIVQDTCYASIKDQLGGAGRLVVLGEVGVEELAQGVQILTDRAMAVRLAVQHAVRLGHRRIALAMGRELMGYVRHRRAQGSQWSLYGDDDLAYRETCQLLTSQPPLVMEIAIGVTDQGIDAAQECLRRASPRPTALVCDMDYTARAFYLAAQRLGLRIPEDLGVIGLGDTTWTRCLSPELTSMNLGDIAMADMAIRCCLDPQPPAGTVLRLQPRLHERQSLNPAP